MSVHASETDLSKRDWNKLLPLIDASVKDKETAQAIFQVFSTGIDTALHDLKRKPKSIDENAKLLTIAYRPFCRQCCFLEKSAPSYTERKFDSLINDKSNKYLIIPHPDSINDFCCVGTDTICDTHFFSNALCIPLYYYNNEGDQLSNITDSACQLFNNHYGQNDPSSPVCYAGSSELRAEFRLDIPAAPLITKETIFHYVYAVLHYPAYREQYGANGKQEITLIPLYNNFHQWAAWGKRLLQLHLHYQNAPPYPLLVREIVIDPGTGPGLNSVVNTMFKANKEKSR